MRPESCFFTWAIDLYLVRRGLDVLRHLVAAEAAELWRVLVPAVSDLDVVVHAVVVVLNLAENAALFQFILHLQVVAFKKS